MSRDLAIEWKVVAFGSVTFIINPDAPELDRIIAFDGLAST